MTDIPVKVATTTGIWTAVGVWVAAITVIGGLLTAIVKQWGPWRKQASDERDADFARLREDVREAKSDARKAADTAQRLENMVACMRPAISILTAEVRRLDPNSATNAAILQVQELMAMAAAGDLGLGPGLRSLADTRGVGE